MSRFTDVSSMYNTPILKAVRSFEVKEAIDNFQKSMDFSTKYCGVMQFGVTFYANKANYQSAKQNAERMVYSEINHKALQELEVLKGIAYKYVDAELEACITRVVHLCSGGE